MSNLLDSPLPSSPESERLIFGAILLNNNLIASVAERLRPEHFYNALHRRIYEAMLTLYSQGREISPITVASLIPEPEKWGGVSFIAEFTYGLPYFDSIDEYIELLSSYYTARSLVLSCSRIITETLSSPTNVNSHLETAESTLFGLSENAETTGFIDLNQLVCASLGRVRSLNNNDDGILGLATGYSELDSRTSGLHASNLIIIAARPSMGKTALAINIAQNICFRNAGSVAIFSLEMSKEELVDRIICSETALNTHRYRTGMLQDEEWARIEELQQVMENARLFIDDTAAISVAQMRNKLRRLIHQHGSINCVMVDYLQLMTGETREGREREVAKISRDLKALSKEFNIPVVALSQLNRSPESRSSHIPTLADLRESGAIEQDADLVMFIYREDQYNPDPTSHNGLAQLIIAKHRNGPTGTFTLRYDSSTVTFREMLPSNF